MASSSSFLSEEQFQCSICLEVFNEPVSTPCGHNFCEACIGRYWNNSCHHKGPLCTEKFDAKPELKTNTTLKEIADHFRAMTVRDRDASTAKPGEVVCEVCTGRKLKAFKSCLECLTSYCETHLEPHQLAPALRRHKLLDPVESLEDRACGQHNKLLELFCKTDQIWVCQTCIATDHKNHHVVMLEEECGERSAELREMIQERLQKVHEIKHSVELSQRNTEREMADCNRVLMDLMSSVEGCRAAITEMIEEKQKATKEQAEGFIEELQEEISELQRRATELEQLSHANLHLLQSSPPLCPPTLGKDWSDVSIHLGLGKFRRAQRSSVAQLEEAARRAFAELEELTKTKEGMPDLKALQQHAVDVTLDIDTAHPILALSRDRKQVKYEGLWNFVPDNPKRFQSLFAVLGHKGFHKGKFYFEVKVTDKLEWSLGVASNSITRKKPSAGRPEDGIWALTFQVNKFVVLNPRPEHIYPKEKVEKVGVLVHYEAGQVSFYDVKNRWLIYSYSGMTFTETLYPYLNPCDNEFGPNTKPLVICPVERKHMYFDDSD
ncbi:E3 ubiquitin-protein ligase TRIM39-like [Hypomesus transpacificus]|uniref:E3 ubiquitin-protein ligase TRIM39-like n=1 Tax=Hypomesus transpacificus TaxID=137520 RepID=UPI001F07243B|nr:E3 ubiquitin-protein ligase TRIM39-like [Hypomesus transpacificus]XP_046887851.1 E3 ubiquitin-protein ligase TRIM39-like [Hypomesus transpacificus]